MIVTTLIGILAMMATTAFTRLGKHAEASAYSNDGRVFAESFSRHAQERGSYPADQTVEGTVPAGMDEYLKATNWLRTTPLGGRYEWDNRDATNSLGVVYNAAIKVTGCTWTMGQLMHLDQSLDDGNLSTGNIVVTDAGATVIFVIEKGTL
jgi:type II secretory pathway pseudopilin PulG